MTLSNGKSEAPEARLEKVQREHTSGRPRGSPKRGEFPQWSALWTLPGSGPRSGASQLPTRSRLIRAQAAKLPSSARAQMRFDELSQAEPFVQLPHQNQAAVGAKPR
jgi:hypothetical protein